MLNSLATLEINCDVMSLKHYFAANVDCSTSVCVR